MNAVVDFLTPEWAPNIHPLIVHFPIALLVVAVLLDVLQWIRPLRGRLDRAALLLYFLGVIGATAAFWSGRVAADTVRVGVEAQTVLSDHDDRALITLIFFGAFFVVRLVLHLIRLDRKGILRAVVPLTGIVGIVLLWQTADLGGKLVYQYGVGVAAVEVVDDVAVDTTGESRWEDRDDGWMWHSGGNAAAVFRERIEFHGENAGERLHFHTRQDEEGYYLEIVVEAGEGPLFLVVPEETDDISLEMVANADGFEGGVGLVHHFHAPDHYEFLDYDGSDARLGRHEGGEGAILDRGHWHADGWASLRVAADGRHFHAYADGAMVAHGHAPLREPGYTGVLVDGSGTLNVRLLHLVRLRDTEAEAPVEDHGNDHGPDYAEEHDVDAPIDHDH